MAIELVKNKNIEIVRKNSRTIYTSSGAITFKRRYYFDKLNKQYFYFFDMILNLNKYQRITNGLKIKILNLASELTYNQTGRTLNDDFVLSKSTIYRVIKNTIVEKIDDKAIKTNDSLVHIQIDEKYISIIGKKYKSRLYTATIFKGVDKLKNKNVL